MGAFFKAFWGRLGRNAGNRVSNAIFGDKWSTPYRVAVDHDDAPRRSNRNSSNRNRRSGNSSQQSNRRRAAATSTGSTGSGRKSSVLPWLLGIALFCDTYNAIINPNKQDIVLLVMLWIVAIGWLFFKRSKVNES